MHYLIKKIIKKIEQRYWMLNPVIYPREYLAKKYLKGNGIEIGGLNCPLSIPHGAKVKYVDRLPMAELRAHYPELKDCALANVDIIDDGEKLSTILSGSIDFVIANHFLEHCENPIGAILTFLRVLKKGGVLYMAIPDKRSTFDAGRAVTTLEHILKDHKDGPEFSRSEHFKEWRCMIDKHFKNDPKRDINIIKQDNYSIHFHVWTYVEILELLLYLKRSMACPFELQEFMFRGAETICILAKT